MKPKKWSLRKFINKLLALGDVDQAQVVAEKLDRRETDKKNPPLHTKRKPNHHSIKDGGYVGKDD